MLPSRSKRPTKRPTVNTVRTPDYPSIPQEVEPAHLEPVRYDPHSNHPLRSVITFDEIIQSRPTESKRKIRPPTPSDRLAMLQELEATPPEPLRYKSRSPLRNRMTENANPPEEQKFTAIDMEAQALGVMTTTLESQPSNLEASKRSINQNQELHYLQKQLGFFRQEVALYKAYYGAFMEMRANIEEFYKTHRIRSERLSEADDALRHYWAEHHGDRNEEEVVFRVRI